MQPLIDDYGPVKYIVLPSVAVEHKVNAGPFARAFPSAEFYAVDQQYSFPIPLPSLFLGLPRWTKPLPRSSEGLDLWGGELEHDAPLVARLRNLPERVVSNHAAPKRLAVDCQRLALDAERQYAALQIKFDVARFGLLADWHCNRARLRRIDKRETSGCGSCSAAAEAQNIGRARCWRIGGETWRNGEGRRAGHERHEQGNHGDVEAMTGAGDKTLRRGPAFIARRPAV